MIREVLNRSAREAVVAINQLTCKEALEFMEELAVLMSSVFRKGNKVILAGNGGSLCDASHFAEELTGIFRHKRPALPALVLAEPGHLTCVGNDLGFEAVFSRGLEAFGKPGDLFIGLTTSGNSPNLVQAFEKAKQLEMFTVAFLGKGGGKLRGVADLEWIVEGFSYSDRIQEAHMAAIHIVIEALEILLFSPNLSCTNKQLALL